MHYTHSCELAELSALHSPTSPSLTSSPFLYSQHKCVSNKLLLLLFCFSAKQRFKPASVLTLPAGLGAAVLHLPHDALPTHPPHDIECRLAAYPSFPNCCIVCQIGSSLHSQQLILYHFTTLHSIFLLSLTHPPLICLPLPRLKLDNLWGWRAQEIFFLPLSSRF